MAKQATKQNELLLPALALSALVLLLVGVLVTRVGTQTPESQASASQARLLTKGLENEDLQADLLLLSEDNLDAELSALSSLE